MVEKKKTRSRKKTAKTQVVVEENAKIKVSSPLSKQKFETEKHNLGSNKIITLLSNRNFFVVLIIIFFVFIISLVGYFKPKFNLDMEAGKRSEVAQMCACAHDNTTRTWDLRMQLAQDSCISLGHVRQGCRKNIFNQRNKDNQRNVFHRIVP